MEIEEKVILLLPYISLATFGELLYGERTVANTSKFRIKLYGLETTNANNSKNKKKFNDDEKEKLEKIIEIEVKNIKKILDKLA